MKISVAREGVEIGDWTEEEIRVFLQDGQLLPTDYYWREGMTEWKSLSGLVKPPLPGVSVAEAPIIPLVKLPITHEAVKWPIINRLRFAGLFLLTFGVAYALTAAGIFPASMQPSPIGIITILVLAAIIFLRMINIGHSIKMAAVHTLLAFLPLIGLVVLGFCFLKPPSSVPDKSASQP
jgi:hypothetical protein